MKAASIFSGAMGLDLGLESAGFDLCFAADNARRATAGAGAGALMGGPGGAIIVCNIWLRLA